MKKKNILTDNNNNLSLRGEPQVRRGNLEDFCISLDCFTNVRNDAKLKMKTKSGFNLVEITIVVGLLFTTILLCLPAIFNNTKEAKIISSWKAVYDEVKSNFEIFNINEQNGINLLCSGNKDNIKDAMFEIVAPYLDVNLHEGQGNLNDYSFKFYNGARIPAKSRYFVQKFAYQENGNIAGFNWLNCNCTETEPCATIILDVNGKKPPNRLGKDVFGMFLYKNSIEAFGHDASNDELEKDCNPKKGKSGNGANCSEYYLRGGKF